MSAEYDLVRKPGKKGDEGLQPLYPRIVSKGTVSARELVDRVVQSTGFSYGDVEGVLTELTEKISDYLIDGYHVGFGKMGYFSAKLSARPVMDKKEIRSSSIYFDNVNFRPSAWFKGYSRGEVRRSTLGFRHSEIISEEERYRRMEEYLGAHPFITRKNYSGITGLLKNMALNDLNNWVESGVLDTLGNGSHKVYIRASLRDKA